LHFAAGQIRIQGKSEQAAAIGPVSRPSGAFHMMLPRALIVSLACLFALCACSLAADKGKAYTNAAEAGPDFQIQGEYLGEFPKDGGKMKAGMHIIALGEGKFHAVGHMGGLPGEGSTGKDFKGHETDGELKDGVVILPMGANTGTIKDGVITVRDSGGTELFTLKKVERKSPTLGMKPPEGAMVLFDGSTVEHFNGGKMTEDKLLMVGVTSKQKFRDFTLHLEFRLPFMPDARGQGRANSGVYLQDRYECQILDSFGLKGLNNECGGFYSLRDPDYNMCYPPLSWQTYDIDFTAARFDDSGKKIKNAVVTVRHNGVAIHKEYELPGPTPGGKPETAEPGPLQLQNHGNPVHFRNIWVVEKKG
jgi:hypothetical protein